MACFSKILLIICSGLLLFGCASSDVPQTSTEQTGDAQEPDNAALHAAVTQFLQSTKAPVASTYRLARIDLNGDHRRDAVVIFKTPYGYWCGINGCTMLVFRASREDFTLVNAVQPVREPIFASTMKTNGWNDLVVRVSGRQALAKDVALKFDGLKYPADPSSLPPFPKKNYSGYTKLIH